MRDSGDHRRLAAKQRLALDNPIRLRILELFVRDRRRSLTAEALHGELVKDRQFRHLKIKQVGYHLAYLRDARLLPGTRAA
jgi:hypothetical protein